MTTTETRPAIEIRYNSLLALLNRAWQGGKRRVWLEGGTYASKTYSVMQFLSLLGEHYPDPLHMTVISETMPHLKQGAMLDFRTIMGDRLLDKLWNRTDFIYTWPSGSWMQFISADNPSKAAGPRRDILFVNEANHCQRDVIRQADMRTHLFTIADWNPEGEFWFHDEELQHDEDGKLVEPYELTNPDDVYIHRTYLDALDVMPEGKRHDIERLELTDPNSWRIYGLGLLGKIAGLVYPNFSQVEGLPEGSCFYGLDYGFSSDPTVLTRHVIIGENLYSQEVFYDYNAMTNDDIAREAILRGVRSEPVYADGNEPKSAEELRRRGLNVIAVDKTNMRQKYRIQRVNQFYQHWTTDSVHCIKEQRNHRFLEDKQHSGRYTDDVTHRWSHGMSSREFAVCMVKPSVTGAGSGVSPAVKYDRGRQETGILELLRRSSR